MNKKILALCYDFDKTLTPSNMQEQGFIQQIGFDIDDFWANTSAISKKNQTELNLAYMYMMMSTGKKIGLTKEKLIEMGSQITLYKGVDSWFERVNKFGEENGVLVEHYIISSGVKEMIEGSKIAKEFKQIYASSFMYNENGEPIWPANVINYTNKTQFLFRISKGALDPLSEEVNAYLPKEDYRVPFTNIIYIGDSDTDIPCMKLVSSKGGNAIGVYDGEKANTKRVEQMLKEGRIKCYAEADYSKESKLEKIVKNIIESLVF